MMDAQQDAAAPSREHADDETLLREGHEALRERLGVLGSLRFLRLISGESDDFEDIRREWEDLSEEELLARAGMTAQ